MPVTIKLSNELIQEAKNLATETQRSVPEQIEHWSKIGKLTEQNPDLPFSFIQETLLAIEESKALELERKSRQSI